jgi:NTP pyrophosphatase (non-canonical NTP hydrolase)
MKTAQEYVKRFNDEREWSHPEYMHDLLLNIVEETGEAWNNIKWLKEEKLLNAIADNHDEMEDFVGDMLYLVFKIAYLSNVDTDAAFKRTMIEYEKRFPVSKVKGKHANIKAGGYDGKYEK